MDKEDVVCISQWNTPEPRKRMKPCHSVSTWMDPEIIILNEVSQK